jgi:hypothetical protein
VRIERTLSLQADYPFADRWQLSGELRHMLEELEVGERREETLGGVRLGFDVTDDVNVYTTRSASAPACAIAGPSAPRAAPGASASPSCSARTSR